MRKLLSLILLISALNTQAQTIRKLLSVYPNGMPNRIINDTTYDLTVQSNYLTTPSTTSIGFDSSKVVTEVVLNSTSDSFYVYKGGVKIRAIKVGGTSGGGGTPGGSNTQVQFNNSGAFGGASGFTWDGRLNITPEYQNNTAGHQVGLRLTSKLVVGTPSDISLDMTNTTAVNGKTWSLRSNSDGTFDIRYMPDTTTGASGISPFKGYTDGSVVIWNSITSRGSQANSNGFTLGSSTGSNMLHFGTATPSGSNYSIYAEGSGTDTYLNGTNSINFRISNGNRAAMDANGSWRYFTATSTPATPASGQVVEWWDGTNKRWKKSDGTSGIIY